MRTSSLAARARVALLAAVVTASAGLAGPLAGQSLTSGGLRGVVLGTDGSPITGVQITVEGADGRAMAYLESDLTGQFGIPLLAPGTYRVLAEDVGLQPVRLLGVTVVAGQTTAITFRLERRPPPIERVEEQVQPGVPSGSSLGRIVMGRTLSAMDRNRSATDVSRDLTEVVAARDASDGYAISTGGLPATSTRLFVDGLNENLMRHPGLPGEPASAPLFQRDMLSQVQALGLGFDAEWRGYPGSLLTGYTAPGGNELGFRPYATFSSAALGKDAMDNPADSAGNSFQAGASISGAIIPDTAHFNLRLDFQQLRTPSAAPWLNDAAVYDGAGAALGETLAAIAADSFGVSLDGGSAPTVRTWRGFSGQGRVDWRLTNHAVALRFGYANWTEENPLLQLERSNLSGVELQANDLSGALGVTSTWTSVANEFRIGFATGTRDWQGSTLPATSLAAEGIAFGSSGALPALFDRQAIEVSNALQFTVGQHRLKLGGSYVMTDWSQDYRYGRSGVFTFGSLDGFGLARGTYYQTVASAGLQVNPRIGEYGVFFQDAWSLSPEISMLLGGRFDGQTIPDDLIGLSQGWLDATGERNDFVPKDQGFSPRAALVWDVQNRGEWIVRGGAGLYRGSVDPAVLSEAGMFDGAVSVRRGQGTFASWPNLPDAQLAADRGDALTFFNSSYKAPRTFKAGLGISHLFPSGLTLHLAGSYHHTDYLLRRTDRNLVPTAVGETQEGRPVYGTLIQQGGLVSPKPGSNRRFDDFDVVAGLSPTGFSDYYEFSVALERQVAAGLSIGAAYTYSQTKDNVLGGRALDPADGLNPFPEGLSGADWADGISDFDVPHRGALSLEYRGGGNTPVGIGARWRFRSGLPFTPGFRPGVDVNGDGAGNNDPAFLDAGISGLSAALAAATCTGGTNVFAGRNSCREEAAQSLDLRVSVGLPMIAKDGSRLMLTVDAFNVVSSAIGIVDRALVLVDPEGQTVTDARGNVTLPLIANPNFGSLAVRRNDPRLVRIGLRMEY